MNSGNGQGHVILKQTGRTGHCPEERSVILTLHGLWTGLGNSNQ